MVPTESCRPACLNSHTPSWAAQPATRKLRCYAPQPASSTDVTLVPLIAYTVVALPS